MESKTKKQGRLVWLLVALGALVSGCGKSAGPMAASSPNSAHGSQPGYQSSDAAPPPPPQAAGAPMPMAEPYKKDSASPDRPGLATQWGETRSSHIRSATFYRADSGTPSATAALWYNDAEGSRSQASAEGYRRYDRGEVPMAQSGLVVSLRDGAGRPLPGYQVGGKTFAVGESGERYTIWLENRTPARFEVVVSVDGLDVIDGKSAAFGKRGYLINPHSSLEIDGFRQSEDTVAAFRFGSVRGSYAARKGDDRNVGVIGVAVFHERGFSMWPWDPQEIERRRDANPFPGQFATPPP